MIIIWLIFAYLIGSVSSAVLYCRLTGLGDPRTQGSGNPGATNVLRLGGKKAAVIVLIADVAKGLIPVGLASLFSLSSLEMGWIALAAVLGHIFPVFFRFQGGKGIATAFGCIVILSWPLALTIIATWILVAVVTRYSSLAAIVASVLAPVYNLVFFHVTALPLILMCLLLIWRHQANIQRLIKGTEPKLK